jgi:hypothetical protein
MAADAIANLLFPADAILGENWAVRAAFSRWWSELNRTVTTIVKELGIGEFTEFLEIL